MAHIANIALAKDLSQVMKSTLKYKGVRALSISSCNSCPIGLTHEEQKTRTSICRMCSSSTPEDVTIQYAKHLNNHFNPPIQDGPQENENPPIQDGPQENENPPIQDGPQLSK